MRHAGRAVEVDRASEMFQVCEPHLDLLALAPRLLEEHRCRPATGNVPCVLCADVTWNFSKWVLRTAQGFEFATVTIELPGKIKYCRAIIHKRACRPEYLSRRTVVDVARRVVSKLSTREVPSSRL